MNASEIKWIPIESSSIVKSIAYHKPSLFIKFKNDRMYQYFTVPEGLFEELKTAESIGKYVDRYVKKGGYLYKEIKPNESLKLRWNEDGL